MTVPRERTKAVVMMGRLVEELIPHANKKAPNVLIPRDLICQIVACLRHYPGKAEIDMTAEKVPDLWGGGDS